MKSTPSFFSSLFSTPVDQIEALDAKVGRWSVNVLRAFQQGAKYSILFGRRYQVNNSVTRTLNDIIRKIEKYRKRTDVLVSKIIKKSDEVARWKNGAVSARSICVNLSKVIDAVETEQAKPDPKLNWFIWVALKIHRFFGNLFFSKQESIKTGKDAIFTLQTALEGMARTRIEFLKIQLLDPNCQDQALEIGSEILLINEKFQLEY